MKYHLVHRHKNGNESVLTGYADTLKNVSIIASKVSDATRKSGSLHAVPVEVVNVSRRLARKRPLKNPRPLARPRPFPSEVKAARKRLLKKHAGNKAMVKRLRARFRKADR